MSPSTVEGFRRLRRNRCERLAQGGKHLEHQVEPADLEDFRHHGLHGRDHHARGLRPGLGFLGGEHQAAQAGARHVFEPGHIQHQRSAVARAGVELGREVALEGIAVVVIQAAVRRDDARAAVASMLEGHEVVSSRRFGVF